MNVVPDKEAVTQNLQRHLRMTDTATLVEDRTSLEIVRGRYHIGARLSKTQILVVTQAERMAVARVASHVFSL